MPIRTLQAAVATILVALYPYQMGAAQAAPNTAYVALAVADAARLSYEIPNFNAVTTIIDGGGPSAQASLESSGLSKSYAALPYPGENAIAAPGLVAAFGGPSLPDYPLYVQADAGTNPEASLADPSGSYALKANASLTESSSRANAGRSQTDISISSQESTASVRLSEDGKVVSRATTTLSGIAAGNGVLSIPRLDSFSETVLEPGADTAKTSEGLKVLGAAVGGQPVTITPDGVVATPATIPIPIAASTKNANEVLKQAGIEVRVLEASDVAGGRLSRVLEIRNRHTFPPDGPTGFVTFRIASATTSILVAGTWTPRDDFVAAPMVPDPAAGTADIGGSGATTNLKEPATQTPSTDSVQLEFPPLPMARAEEVATYRPEPSAGVGLNASHTAEGSTKLVRDMRNSMRLVFGIGALGGVAMLAMAGLWVAKGVRGGRAH